MQIESVRRPLGELRDQFLRVGQTWVRDGRRYGAVALRSSAHALTETAVRLDGLASKLDAGDEVVDTSAAPMATADAFPSVEAEQ